jgi:hypothetical protein
MSVQRIAYQYKQNGSVVLYVNGMVTIGKDDVNYNTIIAALKAGDDDAVRRSITVKKAIADLTDGRVEIFGSEVHVDKKPLPKAVADRILTLFRNNFNLNPVFRLLENIESNPEKFSRDELYLFLEHNSLPFTPDGCFLAYKMVRGDYFDIYTGKTIKNEIGCRPEMLRSDVDPNRHNTCSRGLHFCSFDYLDKAYNMDNGQRLMVLKINPADVVSIPSDYNNSKGRTWRYEVVDELPHFVDAIPKDFTDKYSDVKATDNAPVKKVPHVKADISDKAPANYSAKLSEADVRKIKKMLKEDWTIVGIANTFGVSARQIARIRDGEAWADVK